MGDKLFLGLPGLAADVRTVSNRLAFRKNLYELRENRQIKPKTFMSMVSNLLYERRFGPYFVEPVIVGLDQRALHRRVRPDWVPHGDEGFRGEWNMLGADVWDV